MLILKNIWLVWECSLDVLLPQNNSSNEILHLVLKIMLMKCRCIIYIFLDDVLLFLPLGT